MNLMRRYSDIAVNACEALAFSGIRIKLTILWCHQILCKSMSVSSRWRKNSCDVRCRRRTESPSCSTCTLNPAVTCDWPHFTLWLNIYSNLTGGQTFLKKGNDESKVKKGGKRRKKPPKKTTSHLHSVKWMSHQNTSSTWREQNDMSGLWFHLKCAIINPELSSHFWHKWDRKANSLHTDSGSALHWVVFELPPTPLYCAWEGGGPAKRDQMMRPLFIIISFILPLTAHRE